MASSPSWKERLGRRTVSPGQALAGIRPGGRVFIGSGCAEPVRLVSALVDHPGAIDVEVLHIMTVGQAPYAAASQAGRFRHNAFFIGPNVREAVERGAADYTPIFLSEVPSLLRTRLVPDLALVCCSPPDARGFCSLGISVDVVRAAVDAARAVAAEINPAMPRTHGAGFVHVNDIDFFVESGDPVLEVAPPVPDDVSRRIGRFCAGLVADGSTLQVGIGEIPNAVLASLADRRDLGVHSEMISDGLIDLVESGVITGRLKTLHPGKIVTSFCMGTRRLYDYVDDNPAFEFLPTEFVNDPMVIGRNDRMVAINSALQVDLTGQVCADSIGARFYSGIGGQVDFIRGAARSKGGRSVIALPSTAKGGTVSRIVLTLNEGAGVVTTRAEVDTVVTEFGVAALRGRTVRERTLALISIAHPDFRKELLDGARRRRFVTPEQIAWPEGGRPYPVELESRERFNDVDVRFRPVRPDDERRLRDLFYSHSAETVYQRYHAPLKSLPAEKLQELCTLDYDDRMALAGFVGESGEERMIAVGRYSRDRSGTLADVALVVHDDFQGRGIGTRLLARLIEIARKAGIGGFTGYVLAGNSRMLNLFLKCGFPMESDLKDGVHAVTLRFKGRGPDRTE